MNLNESEIIFICYEDIIKTFKPFILQKLLLPEYRENYKEFIRYSMFENLSSDQLYMLCAACPLSNILQFVAKKEFDYESTYMELVRRFDDIVENSKPLTVASNLVILLKQNFVKKIYIYSKYYDERIKNDIAKTYDNIDKMEYICGDFKSCVKDVPNITSLFINDLNYIYDLIEIDKISYKSILVPDLGYNYIANENDEPIFKITNLEKLSKEKIFKLAWFKQFN